MNVKTGKYFSKANCNTLQHLATRCNILQHPATPRATLQQTQHPATPCNTLHTPNAGARQHVMPPFDALLLLCLPLRTNSQKISSSFYAYDI